MALSRTSKHVGDKLVGTVTDRMGGPSSSDQLKSMSMPKNKQTYAAEGAGQSSGAKVWSHHH